MFLFAIQLFVVAAVAESDGWDCGQDNFGDTFFCLLDVHFSSGVAFVLDFLLARLTEHFRDILRPQWLIRGTLGPPQMTHGNSHFAVFCNDLGHNEHVRAGQETAIHTVPFSHNCSNPPNFRPIHIRVVERLKSYVAAPSTTTSEFALASSVRSWSSVARCVATFLWFSCSILTSFLSASSLLRNSVRWRSSIASSACSRARIALSCSRMVLPWLAYWDNADEKWLSSFADASATFYVKPRINIVSPLLEGRYAKTHAQIVSLAEPLAGPPQPQRLRGAPAIRT